MKKVQTTILKDAKINKKNGPEKKSILQPSSFSSPLGLDQIFYVFIGQNRFYDLLDNCKHEIVFGFSN